MLLQENELDLGALQSLTRWFLLCALVGLVAGLAAIAFYWLLSFAEHLFLDLLAGYRPLAPGGEHLIIPPTRTPFRPWVLLLLPAAGGVVSGLLVYRFAPEAEGHGTDSCIDAYHHREGRIRSRVPFVKALASASTIGTGGSAGPEGPIAQIAAGFGYLLARWFKLSAQERRILMAAGMGGGIGAIFHAPLAGGLFAAEVLYRKMEFEYEVIVPGFIASIIAYAVFTTRFGWSPLFGEHSFAFRNPAELLPYFLLALVVAAGAVVYVRLFYRIRDFFLNLRISNALKPALGGLGVGLIGFFLPQAIGTGYGVVQGGLEGSIGWKILLVIAAAKIITTAFSIASGGSGGVFGPIVVIGGALGGAVGLVSQQLFPQMGIQPGAFIIVGMAGFFAAAAKTPVSTIIMVSELTGDYQLLVPSMWVCTLAFLLVPSRLSIQEKQLPSRMDASFHLTEAMEDIFKRLRVKDALAAPGHEPSQAVPEGMTLPQLLRRFADDPRSCLPVVNSRGAFIGMVNEQQLRAYAGDRGLDALVLAGDIAVTLPTVTPDETLHSALQKLSRVRDAELAVVEREAPDKLVDTLSRRDLLAAYDRRVRGSGGV